MSTGNKKSGNKKSGKGKRFNKDDLAVSAVIGVILMVAITVVMAAIVSSWSSGVRAPTTPTTVGLDLARSGTNITIVVTAIDPPAAAPITYINSTYTNSTGSKVYSNMSSVNVGDTTTIQTNENGPNLLVTMAMYKDSSKKVLYSRET